MTRDNAGGKIKGLSQNKRNVTNLKLIIAEVSMVINGLNKLTLLDYPGITACTIYTGGCNFRCPFCHNATLVLDSRSQPVISEKEVFDFLKLRSKVLDGVCITGGEPTLNKELPEFIAAVKDLGYKVKLDTNGSNPAMLRALLDAEMLDCVAMDIKNSLDSYAAAVGIKDFDTACVEESAQILLSCDTDYEFRTTVVAELHTQDNFIKIGEWLSGGRAYYLQNFEDSGNLIGSGLHACTADKMHGFLSIIKPYFGRCGIRGIS